MTNAAQNDEISYISGVNADGTIAAKAFFGWDGKTPAGYATGYTDARKWGSDAAGSGATISYYLDTHAAWTPNEAAAIRSGLALLSAVANISFSETTTADGAGISFLRGYDGKASTVSSAVGNSASAGVPGSRHLLQMTGATISIDTSVPGFGFSTPFGYGGMTLLHEEAHAIGLGHAGPYDETINTSAQQNGAYDSRLWSVMSYINPQDASAPYAGQYDVTGTNWNYQYPQTLMPLDILAAQSLYGVATNTPLSGGQTFGFNSNITGDIAPFFDFTKNTTPVVTLWDKGSDNTLDLSGFSTGSTVNLNQGTYSSADGLTNNIAIAYNTAIDTLVCGNGNDTVVCNNDGDTVYTGAGNDHITGGSGNDVLFGGTGTNLIDGGAGTNTAVFAGSRNAYNVTYNGDGSITVTGLNTNDTLTNIQTLRFANGASDFDGNGSADILWQNDNGQAAIWTMNGLSQTGGTPVGGNPGPSWHVVGSADFDGDGKADILWQNSDGTAAIWTMNGTTQTGGAIVGSNPGSSWHIKGAADFTGDGKADILWQNDDGTIAIWSMNGLTQTGSTILGNPGSSWHVIATADFNGDGKPDILWQNDNGAAAIWTMNGLNQTGGAIVGGNPGTSWHIKGAGDFNGDGKADILWQNDNGSAAIWTMDGLTQLGGSIVGGNPGSSWHAIRSTDVNGDGKADIVWQNDNGQVAVWTMSGVTQLGSTFVGGAPGSSWHVATAG